MTVTNSTNRSGPYIGNGVTTVFAREFLVFDADHIRVYQTIAGVTTEVLTGTTKDGISSVSGNVTFAVAPAIATIITLIRRVPQEQDSDYSNQGKVEPETVERDLDLATLQRQDMSEEVGRSIKLPVESTLTDLAVPSPVAGKHLRWNATADGLENGADADQIEAAEVAAQTAVDAAAAAVIAAEDAATFNPANFLNITDVPDARAVLELETSTDADWSLETAKYSNRIVTSTEISHQIGAQLMQTFDAALTPGQQNADFTGFNPTLYSGYKWVMTGATCVAANANVFFYTSTDDGVSFDAGTNDYSNRTEASIPGTSASDISVNSPDFAGGVVGISGTTPLSCVVRMDNPEIAQNTFFTSTWNGGHNQRRTVIDSIRLSDADVNGILFRILGGTSQFLAGTIKMYGILR